LEKAEKEYQEALEIASSKNFIALAFNSMINLGVVERTKGNNKKADSLMNEALLMAERQKLFYAVAPIYLNMSQIAISYKKYDEAERYLDSAMYYSKFTSKNEIQEGYYVLMSSMQEKKGNYKSALEYHRLLTNFRDSLDKSSHLEMMKELQLKYSVEKKEKQRIQEKNTNEKRLAENALHNAAIKQNIGIGLILMLLAIGGFIIYYFREKHKREIEFSSAIVNKLEEERGRIARDLHDGLGQSLIVLKNKFNQLEVNDEEHTRQINENFTSTIEEVRSISRSLIPPELRRLGLKKAILKMLKDVEETSRIMTTSEIDILDELNLDDGQEIRIYRILQELLNNTMKHSQATSLKISLQKIDGGFVAVYQDNGIGFEHEAEKETNSIGLRSIEQRLRYLNGTIKIEKPAKGFKATIRIKLKRS
jgi:signal transduction histidine kinase